MRQTWTFHSAGQILFGPQAISQLGDVAGRLGAKRVLIVTDPILVKAGILDRVRQPLAASGMLLDAFTEGEPEPSLRSREMSGTSKGF